MAEGEPHIDLLELCFEARLATVALVIGIGSLMKAGTPSPVELDAAQKYLTQAGQAIDAAEALLSLKPLPLAPLLAVVEELPENVVAFTPGRR
jgi:hypothetical protein